MDARVFIEFFRLPFNLDVNSIRLKVRGTLNSLDPVFLFLKVIDEAKSILEYLMDAGRA